MINVIGIRLIGKFYYDDTEDLCAVLEALGVDRYSYRWRKKEYDDMHTALFICHQELFCNISMLETFHLWARKLVDAGFTVDLYYKEEGVNVYIHTRPRWGT